MKHSLITALATLVLFGGTVNADQTNLMTGVHRISFAGDSLIDGSAWPDWVLETLQANGYPNLLRLDAGVAGDNAPQLKARFQHDVVDVKPDLVVLCIGTTDREPIEEYRRAVEWMVQQVRQGGSKILLMTSPGVNLPPGSPFIEARVIENVEVVRALAKQLNCPLVDLYAAFVGGTRSVSGAEQTAVSQPNLPPEEAARTSRILWGPDGVHHTRNGWRTMARCVLDALDCHAPLIEKTVMYSKAVTDWYVGPSIAWSNSAISTPRLWSTTYVGPTITWSNSSTESATANTAPVAVKNLPPDYDPIAASRRMYPTPPEIPDHFNPLKAGWRKFDREAEIAKTSWWQKSWLERGGVMPMGQDVVKDHPGAMSKTAGAFSLAIVHSDKEMQTILHVGGSPPYAVWLNGKFLWNGQFLHGYHPSADRILVTLHKGDNNILVFSNWLFYISLGEI